MLSGCLCLSAQNPTGNSDLTQLSLEDLLKIEVTSVARKPQKLSETASAVYVITEEDIRRSGVTSIPEALRMAPGVQVAQIDSSKWSISIRGFSDQFAAKLLVMIDGRSVYNQLFSGVYWDVQDVLLEDIEHIEVIRGPGGTMWGANAVNGIVNIITKHTRDTQGGVVDGRWGNQEGASEALRYGGRGGSNLTYRFYSKHFNRKGNLESTGERAGDDWHIARGGFRMDWERSARDSFMLAGDLYDGNARSTLTMPSRQFPFSRTVDQEGALSGSNLMGRWRREVSEKSNLTLNVFLDHYSRDEVFLNQSTHTADVDFQNRLSLSPRNELVWGAGYRRSWDHLGITDFVRFEPADRLTHVLNTYLQDDVWLKEDRLLLTVGSKLEHNSYTGWEVQPGASLLWKRTRRETGWVSMSRAVRTPSRFESDTQTVAAGFPSPDGRPTFLSVFGNPNLRPEELRAHEIGYRVQQFERVTFDVAGFYNAFDHLETVEPGPPFTDTTHPSQPLILPLLEENNADGETAGAEMASTWQLARSWKLHASYSLLRVDLNPKIAGALGTVEDVENRAPVHQFHARSYLDLPAAIQFDTAYYYVNALKGIGIPSIHRVDCRMGWRPTSKVGLSLVLQNLLDNQHPEITASGYERNSEIGRSVYGRITWRF